MLEEHFKWKGVTPVDQFVLDRAQVGGTFQMEGSNTRIYSC